VVICQPPLKNGGGDSLISDFQGLVTLTANFNTTTRTKIKNPASVSIRYCVLI